MGYRLDFFTEDKPCMVSGQDRTKMGEVTYIEITNFSEIFPLVIAFNSKFHISFADL